MTADRPTTAAGRALLASAWQLAPGEPLMLDTILAIEAEARQPDSEALAAALITVGLIPNTRRGFGKHPQELRARIARETATAILAALPPSAPPALDRCPTCDTPWFRQSNQVRLASQPLEHGYSPRPDWAGTCPRCGAVAGTDCAVLTSPSAPPALDVERLVQAIKVAFDSDGVDLVRDVHRAQAQQVAAEYARLAYWATEEPEA